MYFYLKMRQNKCFVFMMALILIAKGNVKPLAFAAIVSKHYSFIQYVSHSIGLSNKYMIMGWNFVYVSFMGKKKHTLGLSLKSMELKGRETVRDNILKAK